MADYISRQAVKEKLINNLTYMNVFGTARSITLIDEVPSADVQPVRHGWWIDTNGRKRYPFWVRYECSECGAKASDYRFCPHCGARMDEVAQ